MEDESSPASTVDSPPAESKAQEQARLRRERRNAKIQSGGSERLSKITSLSGRTLAAEAELAKPPKAAGHSQNASRAGDPAEVDISSMFNKPAEDISPEEQQEMLRQMLAATSTPPPGATSGQQSPELDDPLLRMMQQMMGSAGMGGGGTPMDARGEKQPAEGEASADYLWRIVHAVFFVGLGLYAALSVTFNGTELSRAQFPGDVSTLRLFWMFATAEGVLQSSRYFIDQGKLPVSGILSSVGRMLPEPYANYVRIFNRYSIIYTTIMTDAMVLIFVLGFVAWWNDLAAV